MLDSIFTMDFIRVVAMWCFCVGVFYYVKSAIRLKAFATDSFTEVGALSLADKTLIRELQHSKAFTAFFLILVLLSWICTELFIGLQDTALKAITLIVYFGVLIFSLNQFFKHLKASI